MYLNEKDRDRQKLCRKYNNNVSKCLAHRVQINFQIVNAIKATLKLETSATNAATYYFSSINGYAEILLVRLSLNKSSACYT